MIHGWLLIWHLPPFLPGDWRVSYPAGRQFRSVVWDQWGRPGNWLSGSMVPEDELIIEPDLCRFSKFKPAWYRESSCHYLTAATRWHQTTVRSGIPGLVIAQLVKNPFAYMHHSFPIHSSADQTCLLKLSLWLPWRILFRKTRSGHGEALVFMRGIAWELAELRRNKCIQEMLRREKQGRAQ